MHRTLVAAIVAALSLPAPLGASPPQARTSSVEGKASTCTGQAIGNSPVQARDLSSGQIAGKATTASDGTFTLQGLPTASYVFEVLNDLQQVVATSANINVASAVTISNVSVREGNCSPAAAAAVGSTAASGGGLSTAAWIAIIAAASAAGIGGITAVVNNNASPSQ